MLQKHLAGIRSLMALTVAAGLAVPAVSQASTLSDSISRALSSHPAIEAGKATASAAGQTVREQKSSYFPTISAGADTGRVYMKNDTTRANTNGAGASSWTSQSNVVLTQPIFAGFGNVNRVAAAEGRRDSAAFDLGDASESVALRAARAHLNLMRTRELLDLADTYYSDIQARHDSIALMVKEGASDEAEELQAQEILSAAKNTRLGYEEAYRQAEADYIESVGGLPDGALEFGAALWEDAVPLDVDRAVSEAVAHSPRVLSADRMVQALGREAEAAKGELYPRLDAELSYSNLDQKNDLGGTAEDGSAKLRMSWAFSTGGAQFARIGRSLSAREEAAARKHEAEREVAHDVRQKFTSMQIVDEQFGLLAAREQDLQKILDNYKSQFEAGKQSNLQLISAHARLFEAKAARTDAYYRRLLSRFELLNDMGGLRRAFGIAPQEDHAEAASAVWNPLGGTLDKVKQLHLPSPGGYSNAGAPEVKAAAVPPPPVKPAAPGDKSSAWDVFDVKGY